MRHTAYRSRGHVQPSFYSNLCPLTGWSGGASRPPAGGGRGGQRPRSLKHRSASAGGGRGGQRPRSLKHRSASAEGGRGGQRPCSPKSASVAIQWGIRRSAAPLACVQHAPSSNNEEYEWRAARRRARPYEAAQKVKNEFSKKVAESASIWYNTVIRGVPI